ncbi:MAG: hypothetical protein DCC75_10505, partial [Proteobacteria bacterium]
MANTTSKNWINAKALNAPELEEKCRARLQARLSQGLFEEQDLDNISKRKISLIEGEFCTSDD